MAPIVGICYIPCATNYRNKFSCVPGMCSCFGFRLPQILSTASSMAMMMAVVFEPVIEVNCIKCKTVQSVSLTKTGHSRANDSSDKERLHVVWLQ